MTASFRRRLGAGLLASLLLTAAACEPDRASSSAGLQKASPGAISDGAAAVTIRGHRITAEIAETPAEQALGLGQRDSLAWDTGMLFVYQKPAFYAFWMKGMRFSIDIIWIYQNRIVGIEPNVPFEPGGNGPTVRPQSLVDAVLEVPAGYCAARGWQRGDPVEVVRSKAER